MKYIPAIVGTISAVSLKANSESRVYYDAKHGLWREMSLVQFDANQAAEKVIVQQPPFWQNLANTNWPGPRTTFYTQLDEIKDEGKSAIVQAASQAESQLPVLGTFNANQAAEKVVINQPMFWQNLMDNSWPNKRTTFY